MPSRFAQDLASALRVGSPAGAPLARPEFGVAMPSDLHRLFWPRATLCPASCLPVVASVWAQSLCFGLMCSPSGEGAIVSVHRPVQTILERSAGLFRLVCSVPRQLEGNRHIGRWPCHMVGCGERGFIGCLQRQGIGLASCSPCCWLPASGLAVTRPGRPLLRPQMRGSLFAEGCSPVGKEVGAECDST